MHDKGVREDDLKNAEHPGEERQGEEDEDPNEISLRPVSRRVLNFYALGEGR